MAMRDSWVEKREAAQANANGSRNMSQMHLARLGVITEEMEYVAKREKLDPEVVRSEAARGRAAGACAVGAEADYGDCEPRRFADGALDGAPQETEFFVREH